MLGEEGKEKRNGWMKRRCKMERNDRADDCFLAFKSRSNESLLP